MVDEVEQLAEAIYRENFVSEHGVPLNWEDLVRKRPDRVIEFREAARNRIRAEEAMKFLSEEPNSER